VGLLKSELVMSSARFTVLLCVHRPPTLLPFAIETVLWQSHNNLELFVVCDGAPPETAACARTFAARDSRVRVFEFGKGERNGERHRAAVLNLATGDLVAHLADDDLWLPDHLKELAILLSEVEFGNLLLMGINPDGSPMYFLGDLADPKVRQRMISERWNFFGPTVSGYRLSTYRRMPEGWSPAPAEIWSDLYMWRKFLRLDGITTATRFTIQALCLINSLRPQHNLEQRREETERWMDVIRDPAQRAAFSDRWRQGFVRQLMALPGRIEECEQELDGLRKKLAVLESREADASHSQSQST
jgi:glycosyltransferase involved in cell wall biosynthesis